MRSRLLLAALLAAFVAPAAQAQRCDTNLRIVNNSTSTVTRLFYNPSRITSWGPNRLTAAGLRPGQSSVFNLGSEENFDFRVVWHGNQAAEMRHTNICVINRVVITDEGMRVR